MSYRRINTLLILFGVALFSFTGSYLLGYEWQFGMLLFQLGVTALVVAAVEFVIIRRIDHYIEKEQIKKVAMINAFETASETLNMQEDNITRTMQQGMLQLNMVEMCERMDKIEGSVTLMSKQMNHLYRDTMQR